MDFVWTLEMITIVIVHFELMEQTVEIVHVR